jgi:nudix-type nucleoside diphosphatase (YffH/AdpP family)
MKTVVHKRGLLLNDFFKVEEALVSYEQRDGRMSPPVRRLDLKRDDAVSAVLVNAKRGTVILVRQFRYAVLSRGDGWMTETIAGLVDPGETPEDAVKREILEEAGYEVEKLKQISRYYPTPGITSERIILFYAETRGDAPVGKGGGLADEHEDIEVVELPLGEAFAMLDRGEIEDGKTIIALMWLQARAGRRESSQRSAP